MSDDPIALRFEANSIKPNILSESQKAAFKQLIASIHETVTDLSPQNTTDEKKVHSRIDNDRKSRMMMISGDRGSGKTTLMLTLQNCITTDAGGINHEEFGQLCMDQLTNIKNRVVWLDPLDMEHSSKETNLFVSILARMDDAIKQTFAGQNDDNFPYNMSVTPVPGVDHILIELRRLQVDASIAWEGNLIARAPSLDSDAFATEVMRAEQARMGLNKRFRKLLDDMARKINWGSKMSNPIFVLAVDDFDLNPSRCLDILKLLRSLNVPRLFTIVLGDEDVAEEVFRFNIQGDMSRIANVSVDAHDGASSSFIRRIKHISPQAVRKLVPPHQRLKLLYNTIEQSIALKPPNSSKSLEDLLKSFRLYTELPETSKIIKRGAKGSHDQTLYDFLIASTPEFLLPQDSKTNNDIDLLRRRYRFKGARILETSLRETIDIWFSLKNILACTTENEGQADLTRKMKLIDEVRSWVRKAAYDDSLLDMESAESFIYEFESDLDPEVFRTHNLELTLPLPKSHTIKTDRFKKQELSSVACLSVNYIEEFKLRHTMNDALSNGKNQGNDNGEASNGKRNNLSSKTQSHLVLLHDLIVTNPLAPVVGDFLVKPIGEYQIVTCDWISDGIGKLSVPWRGAIFRTIRELEIFSNSWDMHIEKIRKIYFPDKKPDVDLVGWSWFVLNLTTLLGDCGLFEAEKFDSLLQPDSKERAEILSKLLLKAIKLSRSNDVGKTRAGWTVDGLLSNFFPGSGLSIEFCRSILSIDEIRDWYSSNQSRINSIQRDFFNQESLVHRSFNDLFFIDPGFLINLISIIDDVLRQEERSLKSLETSGNVSASDSARGRDLIKDVDKLKELRGFLMFASKVDLPWGKDDWMPRPGFVPSHISGRKPLPFSSYENAMLLLRTYLDRKALPASLYDRGLLLSFMEQFERHPALTRYCMDFRSAIDSLRKKESKDGN